MTYSLYMVGERIKSLRDSAGLTQTALAQKLGITRSSVNAWEMGLSVPSTQYLVALAGLFRVSTDYLLGVNFASTIEISGLTDEDIGLVHQLVEHLRAKNKGDA